MPVSRRSRAISLTTVLGSLPATVLLLASHASAAPTPTPSPSPSKSNNACDLIVGLAKDYCENGDAGSPSTTSPDDAVNALDPLSSLARGCADAAAWIVGKLSEAVKGTANVDFTNPKFLQQYAVIFAASTVLTLVLWLLAVAKRAIRGVPVATAISEAVGFLWLTVLASAFTPLILYTVVSATDGVTDVIASSSGGQTDVFFGSFAEALSKGSDIGGGPIMLIVVSLVSILAAGVLWLELVIRAALLYVGALLGVVVYSGLVDKNMWGHVRRWAGIMIAVIMVKPVIVIVLGLAGALSSDLGPNAFSAVVSGLAIILLAIFASAMIYRFVPGFGDEIQGARTNRKQATDGAQAAALISSPAALVSQGIKTHSSRSGGDNGGQGAATAVAGRPTRSAAEWPRTAPVTAAGAGSAADLSPPPHLRPAADRVPPRAPRTAAAPPEAAVQATQVTTAQEVEGVDDPVPSGHASPYVSHRPGPAERDRRQEPRDRRDRADHRRRVPRHDERADRPRPVPADRAPHRLPADGPGHGVRPVQAPHLLQMVRDQPQLQAVPAPRHHVPFRRHGSRRTGRRPRDRDRAAPGIGRINWLAAPFGPDEIAVLLHADRRTVTAAIEIEDPASGCATARTRRRWSTASAHSSSMWPTATAS